MIALAHARKSDISLHLMSKDRGSLPHLVDLNFSCHSTRQAVVESLVRLKETSPGVKLTEYDNGSCHIEVSVNYELPIVAEIIADYWSSRGFIVTRYRGSSDLFEEVETFLTETMKHRYAQGKYTYPYGTTKTETQLEGES